MFRILLFLLPLSLFAGNLADILGYAKENENIKAKEALYVGAQESESAAKRGYLPSLDLGASYNMLQNESMGNPENSGKMYAKASFMVYDGGKREAAFRMNAHQTQSKKSDLEDATNYINLQIVGAYFGELNTKAKIFSIVKKIEQLEAELERLLKFYQVGSASEDEVERIRASVYEAKANLASLELELQKERLNMEWLCGKEVDTIRGSSIVKPLFEDENPNTRADIVALSESVNAQKEATNIKESEMLPSVFIEDTLSRSTFNYDDNSFDVNAPENQNAFMVGISWKIFDFGAISKEGEAKKMEYKAAALNLKSKERLASIELRNAKKAIEISEKMVHAAKARAVSSDVTYDAIRKKFRAGVVNNVTYLDALASKFDAEAELESAQNGLEVKKAEYYYYAGKKIEEFIQ